jgi:voltage-gated potassium channel
MRLLPRTDPLRTLFSIFLESPQFVRIVDALKVFALIHCVGTVGYLMLGPDGTTVIDAFYMTFITVATIGYSEVIDLHGNPAGRLFTVVIALAGIGTMSYMFSNVTAFMLESNLNRTYRRRRMQAQIDALNGHYIVCGAGRIGGYVIEELRTDRRRFVVIENDPGILERHLDHDPRLLILEGDGSDDEMLLRAGVKRAAGIFAVTGDDSKNLVVSLSAKQLNPAVRVVARVHDQRNAAKTLRAGADEIVSPDFTGGHRIASLMIRPQMVSLMDELVRAGGRLAVEEVVVPPRPHPLVVGSLGRSAEWLLVAIRQGGNWTFNPREDDTVQPGHALVVIASPQGKRELQARLGA